MPRFTGPIDTYTISFRAAGDPIAAVIELYSASTRHATLQFRRDGALPVPTNTSPQPRAFSFELALLGPILDALRGEKPMRISTGGPGTTGAPLDCSFGTDEHEPIGEEET